MEKTVNDLMQKADSHKAAAATSTPPDNGADNTKNQTQP
jgi:hypothetical protein